MLDQMTGYGRKPVIGLFGGMGSGKSLVAKQLRLIDCVRDLPTTGPNPYNMVMNATEILTRIRQLSVADRLDLANRLWDEMSQDPNVATLTPLQRQLLDERAREHDQNPDAALPWEQVRDETLEDL